MCIKILLITCTCLCIYASTSLQIYFCMCSSPRANTYLCSPANIRKPYVYPMPNVLRRHAKGHLLVIGRGIGDVSHWVVCCLNVEIKIVESTECCINPGSTVAGRA